MLGCGVQMSDRLCLLKGIKLAQNRVVAVLVMQHRRNSIGESV